LRIREGDVVALTHPFRATGVNACEQIFQIDGFNAGLLDHLSSAWVQERHAGAEVARGDALPAGRRVDVELAHRHARRAPSSSTRAFDEHQNVFADDVLGAAEQPLRTFTELTTHFA
jgi:hypothetical protein